MAVGLKVGPIFYKVGTGGFMHCFFSTIAHRLEEGKWGSKYPLLMNDLYNGTISSDSIERLNKELYIIREELKKYSPDKAVWEIEDLDKTPPWGDNIADRINNLSNYFVTSNGDDLFDVFFKATDACARVNRSLEIKSL